MTKPTKAKPILGIRPSNDTELMRSFVPGMAPGQSGPSPTAEAASAPAHAPHQAPPAATDFAVGSVIDVPLHLIAENDWGARVFYSAEEIDEMAASLRDGQNVDAAGYVDGGRVILDDGQKRARGARVAGLATLRVRIDPPPSSPLQAYLRSRKYNAHRSNETVLDNAVRWSKLLAERAVDSQGALATTLGVKDSELSMVLGLNRIPPRVQSHMKERPRACVKSIAFLIGTMFSRRSDKALDIEPEKLEDIAIDIIERIQTDELTRAQVDRLIAARTTPPRQRSRPETREIHFGQAKGTIKVFPTKGQLEFSIKGVPQERLDGLRIALEGAIGKVQES